MTTLPSRSTNASSTSLLLSWDTPSQIPQPKTSQINADTAMMVQSLPNTKNILPSLHPKTGRRSYFIPEQHIAIALKVAAAEAHIAGFGETRTMCETAAVLLSENSFSTKQVSWKQV